jgi:hypothetical protein
MANESEKNPARRVDDKRVDVPLNWNEPAQAPAAQVPTDVMIDIETLGTTPGAAILSIGAVVFGPEGLGDTFYAPVLLTSCIAVGLTIDPNTVAWWMQQSDEARKAAFRDDADSVSDVLEQFTCWFGLVGAERPWCHGATFDVPLLEAAYKACGMRAPWRFYDVRDTRTLYDLAGVKVDRTKGTHHNALDDACAQAEAAAEAMRIIDVHRATAAAGIEGLTRFWWNSGGMDIAGQHEYGGYYLAADVERLLGAHAGVEAAEPAGDYVLMPKRLTAENGAKGALSGEFKETIDVTCHECGGSGDDANSDNDAECPECNGDGVVTQNVPVSWDTIKDIYRRAVELLAAPAAQAPVQNAEEVRREALEEAARICGQQALEPECPERAEYCAAAIRELATKEAAAAVAPSQWISVEDRLPEKYCLAAYVNSAGRHRIIRAMHVKQYEIEATGDDCYSEYREEDNTEYLKPGWYECIDNWGEYSSCFVNEGTVTHWMPLPEAPQKSAQGEKGGEA